MTIHERVGKLREPDSDRQLDTLVMRLEAARSESGLTQKEFDDDMFSSLMRIDTLRIRRGLQAFLAESRGVG